MSAGRTNIIIEIRALSLSLRVLSFRRFCDENLFFFFALFIFNFYLEICLKLGGTRAYDSKSQEMNDSESKFNGGNLFYTSTIHLRFTNSASFELTAVNLN